MLWEVLRGKAASGDPQDAPLSARGMTDTAVGVETTGRVARDMPKAARRTLSASFPAEMLTQRGGHGPLELHVLLTQ